MQLNEEDKERVQMQLSIMFGSKQQASVIRDVCEQNDWNLEKCLDRLLANQQDNNNVVLERKSNARDSDSGIHENNNNMKRTKFNVHRAQRFSDKENQVIHKICNGYKLMIIMRGAPGSGKSTLAKAIVESSIPPSNAYTLQDFVISADDYFYDATGCYRFCREDLDQAHSSAQTRVAQKAAEGWSPIIVDNTNIKIWEMLPYVEIAIANGYLIELLEPQTPWKKSAARLSEKNTHGVPFEQVKFMLSRYEPTSAEDLIKMARNKYSSSVPQLRTYPPLTMASYSEPKQDSSKTYFDSNIYKNQIETIDAGVRTLLSNNDSLTMQDGCQTKATTQESNVHDFEEWASYANAAPKTQRQRPPRRAPPNLQLEEKTNELSQVSPRDFDNQPSTSRPIRKNKSLYSNIGQPNSIAAKFDPSTVMQASSSSFSSADGNKDNSAGQGSNDIINLLRRDSPPPPDNGDVDKNNKIIHFTRHSVDCVNENKSFVLLRQIYPDKNLNALWDLFVKCGGDANWAADILLKETWDDDGDAQTFEENANTKDSFSCSCSCENVCDEETGEKINLTPSITAGNLPKPNLTNNAKPLPPRNHQRQSRNAQRDSSVRENTEREELKKIIENSFVLPKRVSKVDRIRDFIAGSQPGDMAREVDQEADSDPENDELIQLSLEPSTVKQLQSIFGTTVTVTAELPNPTTPTTVFMRRRLAKDLYMVCVEAMYNQVEEERQKTVREDEAFAKLLKNPNYQHLSESPSNTQELLDMEMAWRLVTSEEEDAQEQESNIESKALNVRPKDLAFHITLSNLAESFPDIPRETLSDILMAHNHNYAETVQVLRSTMCAGSENDVEKFLTPEELQEESMRVKQLLEYINGRNLSNLNVGSLQSAYISSKRIATTTKSPLPPEEAKRIALRDFEETRNMAVHHCQLKAECYQKAKSAIQSGNGAVAFYYSEVANLHKKKIDMFNHRAANCIMDVHKHSQNNPDLLDLHYLHTIEALASLDLFVDRHITSLKNLQRVYKHVFIITGRGLHSHGGISTIKNKVRARLNERGLRWNEVNPGLLKVKIFSASRIGSDA